MDIIDEKIKNKLELYQCIKFEELEDKTFNRLREIETALSKILEKSDGLYKELKSMKPNIVMLVDYTSFSRKTIYNDDLLRTYIDNSIMEYPDFFNEETVGRLRIELIELENRFHQIADKIIDKFTESTELIELHKQIERLSNDNETLRTIISEREREITKIRQMKTITSIDELKKKRM